MTNPITPKIMMTQKFIILSEKWHGTWQNEKELETALCVLTNMQAGQLKIRKKFIAGTLTLKRPALSSFLKDWAPTPLPRLSFLLGQLLPLVRFLHFCDSLAFLLSCFHVLQSNFRTTHYPFRPGTQNCFRPIDPSRPQVKNLNPAVSDWVTRQGDDRTWVR